MKKLCLFFPLALLLWTCSRTGAPPVPPPAPPSAGDAPLQRPAQPPGTTPASEGLTWVPSRERAFARGDSEPVEMSWVPLGLAPPELLKETRYGLLIAETPLLDEAGTPSGASLPRGTRVAVREISPWRAAPGGYGCLYRLEEGWVDAGSVALVSAEGLGASAGIVRRKIAIAGGESEYSVLAIASGNRVSIVDTSFFIFPDAFHPSAPVALSIEDVNADGQPEIVLEAETIVSLQYLGATPLHWVAWLRPRDGSWKPILFYRKHFATDEGYTYDASARSFDSRGAGFRDTVKVSTDYVMAVPGGEFRTTMISFHAWNGSEYENRRADDLPRLGTVTTPDTPLRQEPRGDAAVAEILRAEEPLFVYDRSDTPLAEGTPPAWWYRACTKAGTDGWISGAFARLGWIDPLKVNREIFLGP